MYPKAGGEYVYLRNGFLSQRWLSGTTGIIMTFAGCASAATVALAFASYLQHFMVLPHLLVAGGLLVFFTGINVIGIKQSSWVNAVFTTIEVCGLLLFVWLGWQNPNFGSALSAIPTSATISSAALIIFAFFGFENIVNLAEETKTPEKTIPRAILLSLCISTILYILVSLSHNNGNCIVKLMSRGDFRLGIELQGHNRELMELDHHIKQLAGRHRSKPQY